MTLNVDAQVPWHPDFASRSSLFEPLQLLARRFAQFRDQWPGLEDYQRILDQHPEPIMTLEGKPLKIVRQEGRPHGFEQHYAPRIYLTGEIQTREKNWHDFFQLLTWFLFPETKAVINSIHIPRAKVRLEQAGDLGRRSPMENMLSLFDEGGAVLVSSDESLLQLVRDFSWKQLFWERRDELEGKFQCITFGHAMYEKGLMPYIGMTANCILLTVVPEFFTSPMAQRLALLDQRLAAIFSEGEQYTEPRHLSPFPILGLPGWDPDNNSESYYDNVRYFRPGRRQ